MAKKKSQGLENHAEQSFETAPIYKHARAVLAGVQVVVANMPQQQKYITGKELSRVCVKLAMSVSYAYMENEPRKKALLVKVVLRRATDALVLHRIANDLNLIPSVETYIEQIDGVVSIIKQATGWLESTSKKAAGASPR